MAVACDGGAAQGLTTVGPTLKLYLVDAAASGSSHGTLQINGIAPSVANMVTGWTFGTAHVSNEYSDLSYATNQLATTFTTTVKPVGAPTTTNCFRTAQKMTGSFLAGNWTIAIAVIQTLAGTSGNANLRVRIWRSSDPTGQTAVTEETAATQALATWVISTTTQQNKTKTWAAPEFTLFDEFLFCEIACEVVSGAVSVAGSSAVIVQDGTNSVLTTTNFSTCPTSTVGTTTFFARLDSSTITGLGIMYEMQSSGGGFQNQLAFATANNPQLGFANSADTVLISGPSMVVGQWYFFAVVTFGTTNAILYWKPVGTQTCLSGSTAVADDFTNNPPISMELGQFRNGGFGAPCSFAGFKRWQSRLTQEEIEDESEQIEAIRVADLWGSWFLNNVGDLTCVNNRTLDLQPMSTPTTTTSIAVPYYAPRIRRSLVGVKAYTGTITQNLGGLRQAATGSEIFSGTATQHLGGLRQAAVASEVFSGTVTQHLGGLQQSAVGSEVFSGTATQHLGGLHQAATGSEIFSGSAVQKLLGLRQSASAVVIFSGTVTQNLGGLRQSATGSDVISGTATQRLGGLVQSLSGTFFGPSPPPPAPTPVLPPKPQRSSGGGARRGGGGWQTIFDVKEPEPLVSTREVVVQMPRRRTVEAPKPAPLAYPPMTISLAPPLNSMMWFIVGAIVIGVGIAIGVALSQQETRPPVRRLRKPPRSKKRRRRS